MDEEEKQEHRWKNRGSEGEDEEKESKGGDVLFYCKNNLDAEKKRRGVASRDQ